MLRSVLRVTLAALGLLCVVVGAAGIAIGLLTSASFSQEGAIRSHGQVIEAPGCATLLVELATVRLDAGAWGRVPLLERRSALTITPSGSTEVPWLVGAADRPDVEARLLGARYCLAERVNSTWSVSSIAVGERDPDVRFDGVPGLWATVRDGQGVELPVPSAPTTVVISGDDASSLSSVEVAGEVQFAGSVHPSRIALLGGIGTTVLGLLLLVVSIASLRRKGRHEKPAELSVGAGIGGAP